MPSASNASSKNRSTLAASNVLPWLLLVGFALLSFRLAHRPVLHPGHFLALAGTVAAAAFLLGSRLSRVRALLWSGLFLALLGAEARQAVSYRRAAQTFLICRVLPDGSATVERIGTAHLRDVTLRAVDYTDLHAIHERRGDDLADFLPVVQTIQLGNFVDESKKSSLLKPLQAHGDLIRYQLMFTADNGRWWESMELHRQDGQWLEAARVWRLNRSKPSLLYQSIDPGFQMVGGASGWNWALDPM